LTILYIALGGVAGTLSRYGLEGWIQGRSASGFPLGTLTVNLAGSLLLGFDKLLEDAFGFSVRLAEQPMTCVAQGAALCLSRPEVLVHYAT